MSEEYDWDIYEVLRDQLEAQLPVIHDHIRLLSHEEHTSSSLNELFRQFHTYKSSTAYLKLSNLNRLVKKVETVLSSLREKQNTVQESVIEWLTCVEDQMHTYLEEMYDNKTELSPIPKRILTKLKVTTSYVKPKEKLKTLSVLYMDKNRQRAEKIVAFLEKHVGKVQHSTEEDSANSVFNLSPFNIIITNLDKDNHRIIDFTQSSYPDIALIAIFDKLSAVQHGKLLAKGITHTIQNPIDAKQLYSELISIVKAHYSSANIMIEHKKIEHFISLLQPLPNTVMEIIRICDDESTAINELIHAVKSDPIIAANILRTANSPMYGSVKLKTIDQAVSKFGKRVIKALTAGGIYSTLGSIDLTPYAIDEETFSKVAQTRLALMNKWYSKVSPNDLSLLATTAVLSNIGQLLTAKELIDSDNVPLFQELCEVFDITYAEEFILYTTTAYVSSKILKFFKLSSDLVGIIEHSDKPQDASSELITLCVANHIVTRLVDLKANVAKEIPEDITVLMNEYNFNTEHLTVALQTLNEG
jgi:HD-like signal output (HDOD) protein